VHESDSDEAMAAEASIIEVLDESEGIEDSLGTQEDEGEEVTTNRIFDDYVKEAREERERCNQNMDDMKSVIE
jgi:hypothetical protein